ncbi:MAG: hypothetical protein HZB51_15960 [Chloroflexi bacterium]|nr:hypothetical protein [Chloroflexota bacterium]
MALSDTLHTLRLRNYFTRTFIPRFQSLQNATSQTRLIVMLWSPQSATTWSNWTKKALTELERRGHTVFYSEQLGVSTSMRSKKGVEYRATDTLDLILTVQSMFDPIGDVQDLNDMLVVDAKMLLFIDQAARDRYLYEFAETELAARYNNIESFKFPDDLQQTLLLDKLLAKLNVMQMVKYRAIQNGKNWGLALPPENNSPSSAPTPFRYNLLELYRLNRDELETLLDSTTLFILAYVNQMSKITLRTLWQDMKLEEGQIQPRMMRLQHGKLLAESNGNVIVTDLGKQLLKDVGL